MQMTALYNVLIYAVVPENIYSNCEQALYNYNAIYIYA